MITFPLSLPAYPAFSSRELKAQTVVGLNRSPFSGSQQVYAWPGQWLQFELGLPPMTEEHASAWEAFFLALNGPEGTFYLGDSVRKTSRGNPSGSWVVGSSAAQGSTNLPISGGSGTFALGDWLQIGTGSSSRLHRVVQLNAGGPPYSVEVFPRLRSAYAAGTAITYTNAKGVFRLANMPPMAYDERKICDGMSLTAIEVLP